MSNSTLSNLYVEKSSSEHPIALWMLNEQVDYISQINEDQRQFQLFAVWDVQNAEAQSETTSSINAPFPDSATSRIVGSVPPPAVGTQDIVLTSIYSLSNNLSANLHNVTLGMHIFFDSALSNSVSIGYKYTNSSNEVVEVIDTIPTSKNYKDEWKFFSGTFDLPPSGATDIKLVIKINVNSGGIAGDYDFLINGLSVGQWSEDFNKSSYGIIPGNIPNDINLPSGFKALPAYPYGASGANAYYLSREYELLCKNFGVPLVFGSSNITKIYKNVYNNVNYPSIIFPGYGFLNEHGKHNDYTVEMWVRINSSSSGVRRIFGPINSDDGLYANGAFLTLKIGSNHAAHFVGEWFRPMLIHIRYSSTSAIVLLNGEEVIKLSFNESSLSFPSEFSNEKSQDWLGFYAYEDITPIDLDTFSIFSYLMPTEIAKRRWVWGQAVTSPEQTNSSINSITAFNDYAFANYAANYNYPDFANWKQAFFSNVNTESKSLSLPDYKLPDFSIGTRTTTELFDDIQNISVNPSDPDDVANIKYLTLTPNSSWSSSTDFIHFEKFGVLNDSVESMYAIFKTSGLESNKTLIKIINTATNDYLAIKINNTTVTYVANIFGQNTTIATKTIQANKKFAVGFNVKNISMIQVDGINRFFNNQSALQMYVAGDGSAKFDGKIYKVGFDASYNNRKISSYYDSQGIFNSNEATANELINHTANYTLTAIEKYGLFFADIAVAGYWEDYMPLSYFAKSIMDYDQTTNYELDSIQFNQDFPEPPSSLSSQQTSVWTYNDLQVQYSFPSILTYDDLNNAFYTKWADYLEMSQKSVKTSYYDTEDSAIRSFISFQYITDGANTNLVDFANYAKPLTSGILDPAATSNDWRDTAYEVTTGTVIYPPKKIVRQVAGVATTTQIDFNKLAIVYHLDFKSEGILHQKIKFKELQLASHVLERTKFTPVGSRFGIPVYYYSKTGLYYDLKAKNPIATYKKSTPHLYLNRQSGWKLKGDFSALTDRGLAIPVNIPAAPKTEVSTIQMWIRFAELEFPSDPIMVFSIDHNNGIYDFFIQSDSSTKRGKIFAVDRDSSEVLSTSKVEYYVNGKSVYTPYLVNEEWAVLGIEFLDLLDFSSRAGKISLNGPLTYNNVSYNLATNIEKDETLETRSWNDMMSVHLGGITNVVGNGTKATYTTNNQYVDGEIVTITGVNPSVYNVADVAISVTGGGPSNTFTINNTNTSSYVSGGTVVSGKWSDLQTDLVVIDGTDAPFAWQQVKIISQSRIFVIDPKAIYEKYTGSNRIIVDDESSGIMVKPEKIIVHNEVSWSTNTKIAV